MNSCLSVGAGICACVNNYKSCEWKQYCNVYRGTAKSAEGRISLYLLQPRMNTPKRKGGKNKSIYSLLVAALNEHTQKKKKKGGKKEKKKKRISLYSLAAPIEHTQKNKKRKAGKKKRKKRISYTYTIYSSPE